MKRLHFPAERVRPKAATAPAWLHESAREEWQRVAPVLTRMGVLDETTAMAFAGYCELVHQVRELYAEVDRAGLAKAIASGLWQSQLDVEREILAYSNAMLMTPASRAKAAAEQGEGA